MILLFSSIYVLILLIYVCVVVVSFMKSGFDACLVELLTDSAILSDLGQWQTALLEGCLTVKELCLFSDNRVNMSCAYENGKEFLKSNTLVQSLASLSAQFEAYPVLSSHALTAIKTLATHEEAVNIISQHNITDTLKNILLYYQQHSIDVISDDQSALKTVYLLMKSCLALVRNLCVDDGRKKVVVDSGILDLILYFLNEKDYFSDVGIVESGLACLSNICLRSTPNSRRVDELDGARLAAKCMRAYSTHGGILKQSCSMVRNIAARYPESQPHFLDAGLEPLIRQAGSNRAIVDEAYAALRDLHCEVKMVKVDASGHVTNAFESFGGSVGDHTHSDSCGHDVPPPAGKRALNFNPVFEETDQLADRIQCESRAPFAT